MGLSPSNDTAILFTALYCIYWFLFTVLCLFERLVGRSICRWDAVMVSPTRCRDGVSHETRCRDGVFYIKRCRDVIFYINRCRDGVFYVERCRDGVFYVKRCRDGVSYFTIKEMPWWCLLLKGYALCRRPLDTGGSCLPLCTFNITFYHRIYFGHLGSWKSASTHVNDFFQACREIERGSWRPLSVKNLYFCHYQQNPQTEMHQWPFAPISESCFPSKGGVALQDIFFLMDITNKPFWLSVFLPRLHYRKLFSFWTSL